MTLPQVTVDRFLALRQDVLEKASGGDLDLVAVAEVDQIHERLARHEAEGTAGELKDVGVSAEALEKILLVVSSDDAVVRSPDLGHAPGPHLGLALVHA